MVALSVIIFSIAIAIMCCFYCQSGNESKKLAVSQEPEETTPSMYGAVDAAERGSGAGGNIAASGPAAAINQVLAKGVFLHTRKGPKKVGARKNFFLLMFLQLSCLLSFCPSKLMNVVFFDFLCNAHRLR